LAIEFIAFAIEFVAFAIEFVAFAIEFIPLANEFVTLAIKFVHLANEFVPLAIQFVTWHENSSRLNTLQEHSHPSLDESFSPQRASLKIQGGNWSW